MSIPSSDPWLDLRRLRANAPSTVTKKQVPTFAAALAQAESYHRAAVSAGPETSPVMLYYCLVQLGRAIVLAGRKPPSVAHGLEVADVATATPMLERRVCDTRSGEETSRSHFAAVKEAVGEWPGDPKLDATIGTLIEGNPDLRMLFRSREGDRPILVSPTEPDAHLPLDKRLPPLGFEATIMTADRWYDDTTYPDRLATKYPTRGKIEVSSWAVVSMDDVDDGWYETGFGVRWPFERDQARVDAYTLRAWTPGGMYERAHQDEYVISPLSPTGDAWSRLTWWWPLLYGLGHIARYEALQWADAVDVAANNDAADVRELLRLGSELIPSMGTWAVREAVFQSRHR